MIKRSNNKISVSTTSFYTSANLSSFEFQVLFVHHSPILERNFQQLPKFVHFLYAVQVTVKTVQVHFLQIYTFPLTEGSYISELSCFLLASRGRK